jgi:hypothetical protein
MIMKYFSYKPFLVTALLMVVLSPIAASHAHALSLGNLLGGVTGQRVTIVGDISPAMTKNTTAALLSEISTGITAGVNAALKLKELTLDGLAWGVAQNALNQMTADLLNWVNGGFNGEPAFVTNLDDFLQNIADETAGQVIFGPDIDRLCEPVQFDVRSTLYLQVINERNGGSGTVVHESQCTINDIPGADFKAFVETGDFSKGGLRALFELTVGGTNDPMKAFLNERIRVNNEIAANQANATREADWGDGYLPKKNCETINSATGFSIKNCTNTTMGSVLRDTVSYMVGQLPAERLLNVDEVNEVIGGLAQNLLNQTLQGSFGLLGLGSNSKYSQNTFGSGSQSYADALRNDQSTSNIQVSGSELSAALTANNEFLEQQKDILEKIGDLEDRLAEGKDQYPSCFDLELSDDLQTDRDNAETNLTIIVKVIDVLQQMLKLAGAGAPVDQQNAVYQQYAKLQSEGLVKTSYDTQKLSLYIDGDFANKVAEFNAKIDAELNSCD